mmetsp:Transcript_33880/g.81212  ORF Transcript_33880/g.81212 Transcript_33880/m.81212 type:complete len:213 (+) Transcript_33880:361-999(+)
MWYRRSWPVCRTCTASAGCTETSRRRTSAFLGSSPVGATGTARSSFSTLTWRPKCRPAVASRRSSAQSRTWRPRCSRAHTTSWRTFGAWASSPTRPSTATGPSTMPTWTGWRKWCGTGRDICSSLSTQRSCQRASFGSCCRVQRIAPAPAPCKATGGCAVVTSTPTCRPLVLAPLVSASGTMQRARRRAPSPLPFRTSRWARCGQGPPRCRL